MGRILPSVAITAVLTALAGCGKDSPQPALTPTAGNTAPPFRPADHLPPFVREESKLAVPPQIDGLACADVYVESAQIGRITPKDLEFARWAPPAEGPDLTGKGIPYRAPLDFDKIPDLRTLLHRLGIRQYAAVKVLSIGRGIMISQQMLDDEDYRFYLIHNRRGELKVLLRKNLRLLPTDPDHWSATWVVREAHWIVVSTIQPDGVKPR